MSAASGDGPLLLSLAEFGDAFAGMLGAGGVVVVLGEEDRRRLAGDKAAGVAPSILPNSSCTERGGILKCVCLAQSRPEASITWLMDGNQSFTLDSTQKGEVKSATLTGTIKLTPNVNVSCTAVNTHGTATLVMPVWPHQTTQTWIGTEYLWIIVSVCGVTLLGFVTCLCIRQKRRKIHRDSTNALATLETPLRGKLAKVEGDQGTQDIDNIYKNCNSHMSDPIYDYDIQHCYGNYCPAGNEQEEHDFNNIYLNA